jgi:hypothetical protein
MSRTCSTYYKNKSYIHNFGARFYNIRERCEDPEAEGKMLELSEI